MGESFCCVGLGYSRSRVSGHSRNHHRSRHSPSSHHRRNRRLHSRRHSHRVHPEVSSRVVRCLCCRRNHRIRRFHQFHQVRLMHR